MTPSSERKSEVREPNVHLRIPPRWDAPVYFDRVPVVGDRIQGPDDFGYVEVTEVIWMFEGGFGFPPLPFVIAKPL